MMMVLGIFVGSVLVSVLLNVEIMFMLLSGVISVMIFNSMELSVGGLGGWGVGYFKWDIISYFMVVLSLYLGLLSLVSEEKIKWGGGISLYKILFLSVILMLILCFSMDHMLMFYLFFELVLIPMILLIYFYGYQPERLESGMYMIMYTVFGSLPLLIGVVMMGEAGSLSIYYSLLNKLDYMMEWSWMFLIAFLVKLPLYGVHYWLPKAHVEAPVSGSMILAGVLLKLGCYGVLRVMCFLKLGWLMSSFLVVMGLWGGLLSALMCLRQLDMKKLVAYSSIVHMGIYLSGVVCYSGVGFMGGLMMMVGHGLCSSGLFYMVNLIYSRLFSRSLLIAKGVLTLIPGSSMWGFLLSAANMAAPPFLNIFGEIMLGVGVLIYDLILSLLLIFMYFIGVGYGIYFYSVVSHGKFMGKLVYNVKVLEFLIMFMHFWPVFSMIFVLKFI